MKYKMNAKTRAIVLSVFFGLLVWVLDAIFDYFIFYEGTFPDLILFNIPNHELYIRTLIVISFIIFGIINGKNLSKLDKTNKELTLTNQQLDASNQQLSASEQQLIATNQQLEASNQQLSASEQQLKIINDHLRASEERFRNYIQSSPTSVFLSDKNGNYTFVNTSACKMLGYTENELLQKSMQDVLASECIEDSTKIFRELHKKGEIHNIERQFIRKDGQVIYVLYDSKKLSENEYIAFVISITDRKKAELALKESSNKLESIFLVAPTGIGLVKDRVFREVNPKISEMTGYTQEELIGKSSIILYPSQEEFDFVGNNKYKQIREKGTGIVETKWRKKDGTIIDILLASTPIDLKNIQEGTIFTALDITERKHVKKELILAKEKAEEADRLKSAFLANMSHEIRTPMNSILGFSKLLEKEGLPEEKRKKYLGLINTGGKRLLTIISDIIDVSKIDANQLAINESSCYLNKLIEDLYDQFNIALTNPRVTLKVNKLKNYNESFILTDSVRLAQILSNLIENAMKFTAKGFIEFGYEIIENSIQFYVKDTGIGIDKKYHSLIFERFRQIDEEYTKSGPGTGLGLSIVKGLIELLEGKIWLESYPDKGTTFYFTIPYKPVDQSLYQENNGLTTNMVKNNLKATILIAEDETVNFLYLQELLSDYKCQVIHARNGKEAIDIFKQNQSIDLILMDIKMPILNGFEATSEIRKINKNVPIIAQSAYAMDNEIEYAKKIGCNDYIVKPIQEKELLDILYEKLSR